MPRAPRARKEPTAEQLAYRDQIMQAKKFRLDYNTRRTQISRIGDTTHYKQLFMLPRMRPLAVRVNERKKGFF